MKKIKICFLLLIFLIFSILIELFGFNISIFLLEQKEKGLIPVKDYNMEVIDSKKNIHILVNDLYIQKLNLEYDVSLDVPIEVSYMENDYYDSTKKTVFYDVLDEEVHNQITNFNNNVKKITITYDEKYNIEIKNIVIDNKLHINWFRVMFIFIIFSLIYILYIFFKKGFLTNNLYKYFFIVGFVIGITIIILQPSATYYSWDDQIHFKNVYELRGGSLDWKIGETNMIDGSAIGRNSINSIEEQFQQSKYLNQDKDGGYESYGGKLITYGEISYLPSAIGFYLCRFLNLTFVICFKMGKVFNLLAYLLIMSYAIKTSKIAKKLLVVIGLIPTNLFLACQYSYDPAVMSGITLGVVFLFNWFTDKEFKVDFKNFLIFLLAMLYGSFPKPVYIPLILLFLLVPEDRFRDKKQSIQLKIGTLCICLLVMATFVLPVITNTAVADVRGGNTSVSEQLKLILNHPIGYVKVLNDTMVARFFGNFFGNSIVNFSYIGILSDNLYLGFLFLIFFVFFTDTNKYELNLKSRFICLLTVLMLVLLIFTALYLSFTPVGENLINGVQSRYFLPLMFPLLICFQSNLIRCHISKKIYNLVIFIVPIIIILSGIWQLILVKFCL